ncbi:MAG: type II secretion system F family protein [Phycisphaerales bacterium]
MTELVLAILIGGSIGLFVWAARRDAVSKYQTDTAYLEGAIWRFTPEPVELRPWLFGYYAVSVVLLIFFLFVFPQPVVGLILWLIAFILPKHVIEWRWEKRRKLIDEQLSPTVLQMSSSVASGMTLAQAIDRLAERAPEPIRTEYRVMANQWKHGADFSATIEEAKRRLKLPNFNLFASALLINQRMGGNVVETLERLAYSLESIERMRREVRAATSEGRTNIKVLAVAPFIMLGIVALMDAQAVGMLFSTPFGWTLVSVAFLFTAVGTFWAWRIVNADV